MEPTLTVAGHEAIERDELLVHDWRVKQLKRLGIPGHLAEGAAASHVDWHEIARLVQRGCPRCSPNESSPSGGRAWSSASTARLPRPATVAIMARLTRWA
jgi:hypothetical protein